MPTAPDPLIPPISDRDRLHAAILTTAMEGGVGYWAAAVAYEPGDFALPGDVEGRTAPEDLPVASLLPAGDGGAWFAARPVPEQPVAVWADDDGALRPVLLLTVDTVARGLRAVMAEPQTRAARMLAHAVRGGDLYGATSLVDADLADVIVQVGAFGREVYA